MTQLNPRIKAVFAEAVPPIEQAPETKHYLIIGCNSTTTVQEGSSSLTVTACKWNVLLEHEQLQELCAYSEGCLHPFNTSLVGGLSLLHFFSFLFLFLSKYHYYYYCCSLAWLRISVFSLLISQNKTTTQQRTLRPLSGFEANLDVLIILANCF